VNQAFEDYHSPNEHSALTLYRTARERYGSDARRVVVCVNCGVTSRRPSCFEGHIARAQYLSSVVVGVVEADIARESG
jgi:hypothetical protein